MRPADSSGSRRAVNVWRLIAGLTLPLVLLAAGVPKPAPSAADAGSMLPAAGSSLRFAVVGDYGSEGQDAAGVGSLVSGWKPVLVITTGDNNYPDGAASTIDANIGQYYHEFISPYNGRYGAGASTNRFFPSLGNHDWDSMGARPYLDYFALPGNERYYDLVRGQVHFFIVDSDEREPDGIAATSVQATWLKGRLAASREPWKLVVFHHPAYSSGEHGSTGALQWPYREWGATAVLNGHDHDYERIVRSSFPYFVDGLGGRSTYGFGEPIDGSVVRYNDDYGALLVEVGDLSMTYSFITRGGKHIDTYVQCLKWAWRPGEASCLAAGSGGRTR